MRKEAKANRIAGVGVQIELMRSNDKCKRKKLQTGLRGRRGMSVDKRA